MSHFIQFRIVLQCWKGVLPDKTIMLANEVYHDSDHIDTLDQSY